MKIGMILTIVSASLLLLIGVFYNIGSYQYEKDFSSFWRLADKSSTISKKSEYIDKYIAALEKGNLGGEYNAVFFKTLDNSFDQNFEALKTLQQRLHEISKMNATSFEYQTAIQQITEQEQGEAHAMLCIFKGVWFKENNFLLWNWVLAVQVVLLVVCFITGVVLWIDNLL